MFLDGGSIAELRDPLPSESRSETQSGTWAGRMPDLVLGI